MDRLRVAVVMGGASAERDVSLKSGKRVVAALRTVGHEVVPIDLHVESIDEIVAAAPDVAFLALHGPFGEDGGIQRLLENAGIPFTGSDARASRLGMNKAMAKYLFYSYDVPTPRFLTVTSAFGEHGISRAIGRMGLPVVIKPQCQGSSLGVAIVDDVTALRDALDLAFRYDDHVLFEERIVGRELTVGVLEDRALPIIEIRSRRGFFDNHAKYRDGGTEYIVEPELDELTAGVVQDTALRAHRAIGARYMSRVDVMLAADGRPWVLEVNTIPGLTERSLLPMAAARTGVSFEELCDQLVRMAWRATILSTV